MEKVSVIVPVYNAENYLSNCINTIINQTYENIEIILVNDGSKDDSLNICNEFAEKDDRIIVLNIENSGVSFARNLGLESASGNYITFVDSDDWIELNMVEFAVEKSKKNNADIIMWSYFKNYSHNEKALPLIPGGDQSFTIDKDKLYLKAIYQFYGEKGFNDTVAAGITWCKLYKVDLLKSNNIKFQKELTRAQDAVFNIEAFKKAKLIEFYDENLYHYRINNSSISSGSKFIQNTEKPFNSLLKEMMVFSDQFVDNAKFYEAINARSIQVLLWHLDHKYFHEEFKVNLFKRKKEIKKLIDSEPYKSALQNVNKDLLPKKERTVAKFFKHNLVISFYLMYKLHQLYLKSNNRKYG